MSIPAPTLLPAGSLLSAIPEGARLVDVRRGNERDREALLGAASRYASGLAARGVRPAERVVVGVPEPADYVAAILGCWLAGVAAVAVNPALPPAERANVTAAIRPAAWLDGPPAGDADVPPQAPLRPDDPALILMTSGTTGRPKGIVHTQRSLLTRAELNIAEIGAATLAESLCVLPVFFGHGLIGNILTVLLAGGRVHLWPTPAMPELAGLGPYLDRHGIGFMSSVPSFWKLALRLSPRPEAPLRRVHVGSAPLSLALWRDIAAWAGTDEVYNMFGMTETANWIGGGALADAGARDGYVGRAWGGALAVLDGAGRPAEQGRGEVLVRSPSIMLGYFERPDLDADAFLDGWFRTGDVGELDGAGRVTLVGRLKTEINRGGIKVLAEEVDMLLERHPAISEACAFGLPDAVAGEMVAAAIVLKRGVTFEPEAIKAWCRAEARADAVPQRLFALPAIPRNDRGKIVRAEVREAAERAG